MLAGSPPCSPQMPIFQVWLGDPGAFGGEADHAADAVDVEGDEGVFREDALVDVVGQETAGVVAGEAEDGLGEVVGAEAEELGDSSAISPARECRRRRELDHGADLCIQLCAEASLEHFALRPGSTWPRFHQLELAVSCIDQRNHNFRHDGRAFFDFSEHDFGGRLQTCARACIA